MGVKPLAGTKINSSDPPLTTICTENASHPADREPSLPDCGTQKAKQAELAQRAPFTTGARGAARLPPARRH